MVKIAVIGACSRSFGMGMINDILLEDRLNGSCTTEVVLVDVDAERLARMLQLARQCARLAKSSVSFSATTDRSEALQGADFVLVSVAVHRMQLWEQDFRVPLSLGVKHVLGENGGPGAAFHALRSLKIIMPICSDIKRYCPNAMLLNFTNPEARVLTAILTLTDIRAIGLCHGFHDAFVTVSRILQRPLEELDIRTAGMNHLFAVYRLAEHATRRDLMPELHDRIQSDPTCLQPLTRHLYETFGVLGMNSDDHIGEYLPAAHEFVGLRWPYGIERRPVAAGGELPADLFEQYLLGARPVDQALVRPSGEIAAAIIGDIVCNSRSWRPAVNVLNTGGLIGNLDHDACVEVPAIAGSGGIEPEAVGDLPHGFAALIRRQHDVIKLLVEAYRCSSRRLLKQALLLDPLVQTDSQATKLIDIMFKLQAEFLPEFGE